MSNTQVTEVRDDKFTHNVKHQRFCTLTFIRPDNFCDELKEENKEFYAVKFRGMFENLSDCNTRTEFIKNKYRVGFSFNAENGKWLTLCPNADYINEVNLSQEELVKLYTDRNNELNEFRRQYLIALRKDSIRQKSEKNEKLQNANVVTGKVNIDPERGPIGNVNNITEEVGEEVNNMDQIETDFDEEKEFPRDRDYLDEDRSLKKNIKHQNYFVVSFLTPSSFPKSQRHRAEGFNVWGIKIRGCYETEDDAKERMKHLQEINKSDNIYPGEVGELYPIDIDMDTVDNVNYREDRMNTYLDAYENAIEEGEEREENRNNNNNNQNLDPSRLNINEDEQNEHNEHNEQNKEDNIERTQATSFSNQGSVDDRIETTTRERDELQSQVNRNQEELDNFAKKLEELNAMFSSLK